MLILTRKKDESIIIDDEIKIKVLEVEGNRVQLGIDAPDSISIHREEVYHEIQIENKMAADIKNNLPSNFLAVLKKRVKEVKEEEQES